MNTRNYQWTSLGLMLGLLWTLGGCNDSDPVCRTGQDGCPCFTNGSCLNDLACGVAGLCEPTAMLDGGVGDASPLDGGSDAEVVICDLDVDCDTTPSTAGTLCQYGLCTPCADNSDCVGTSYYGAGTLCSAQGRCERIATCLVDGCPGGGICDEMSGLCRDPLTCDQVGCAPQQMCQESTADADAQCLDECEYGYTWNQVDLACDAISPNCREGGANSILTQCTAELRVCEETEDDASCGDCYLAHRDDGGSCIPVVTCASLTCVADYRICVVAEDHTDAYCGACRAGFTERFGICEGISGANCDPTGPDSILADCAAQHRDCVPAGTSAACGDCIAGTVENPGTGICETEVTCADLNCAAQNRVCSTTWNAQCTSCETLFEEDPATGECRCIAGYLPDSGGDCVTVVTCADIGAGCSSVGELCIEATTTNHAYCRRCFEDEAWYDHWQTCLPCAPCTQAGETGRLHPITSQMGHCVCETLPGYYHSESGLGGTFACDQDGDGWVTSAARLALEAPVGTAERDNARCDLRKIDRIVLTNEAGEASEIPLSSFDFLFDAVPLYESENRDRPNRLQNDLDYTNPNMANYAPALGGGRTLTAAELNPFTKACPTAAGDANAQYADFNANGVADVDELGVQDERADPEGRVFSMFSFFLELHRGYYDHPTGELYGRWVIRERSRGTFALPGWGQPLRYPVGSDYWRSCHRFPDSDFDPNGPPHGMDFASWGANADCAIGGGPGSFCGMNHHSQFKCLLVVDGANLDPDLPHHVTSSQVTQQYHANECEPGDVQDPVTPGLVNASDPAWACDVDSNASLGQAVWGAVKYQDYGDASAPNQAYVRGCINECAEEALLPPDRQCQGPPGPPPILCNGQENDNGRLFCYREIDWTVVPLRGQSFFMGSPDGVACPPWDPGCSDPAATAEAGRDVSEVLHQVTFTLAHYVDLEVMTTEVTQDQFLEFMGYNPSRFDCNGSICPVEQVTFYDAMAMANVMSDRLGHDRCYHWREMRCADGAYQDLYDDSHWPYVYTGNYCQNHGGIDEVYDMDTEFEFVDRYCDAGAPCFNSSFQCEGYRLPTEAEWEFLSRAGAQTAYYAGDNTPTALHCQGDPLLDSLGFYCGNATFRTGPTGVKTPNAFGLFDMSGNVWEWVADVERDYFGYAKENPEFSAHAHYNGARIARGGAWNRDARDARSARRVAYLETSRNNAVGFRLVRSRLDYDRFVVVTTPATWQAAEQDCQARGGHLASPGSAIEYWRVQRLTRNSITGPMRLWIGYNDLAQEGVYQWSDGSTEDYDSHWSTGQPNDLGEQDCVSMTVAPNVTSWNTYNDLECDNPGGQVDGYICELPLP